ELLLDLGNGLFLVLVALLDVLHLDGERTARVLLLALDVLARRFGALARFSWRSIRRDRAELALLLALGHLFVREDGVVRRLPRVFALELVRLVHLDDGVVLRRGRRPIAEVPEEFRADEPQPVRVFIVREDLSA